MRKPKGRWFGAPSKTILVVDIDHPKPFSVSFCPLKIIQEWPCKISPDIDTIPVTIMTYPWAIYHEPPDCAAWKQLLKKCCFKDCDNVLDCISNCSEVCFIVANSQLVIEELLKIDRFTFFLIHAWKLIKGRLVTKSNLMRGNQELVLGAFFRCSFPTSCNYISLRWIS